jgi:hypothetical protein
MDKVQRAGRTFLLRLIARHGPAGAARVLRALADELDGWASPIFLTPRLGGMMISEVSDGKAEVHA